MMFRGRVVPQTDRTITYVIPIHDVFEDVKMFSKGSITEIEFMQAGN